MESADLLHLYEQYEWRTLFDGGEEIRHSGIWPHWKGERNRRMGRPEPDWRFANGRLYMGSDVMGIGNPQKEGEYLIRFETTVLPVRFILWGGQFLPVPRGETRFQTGIDITVTPSGGPGSYVDLSVAVYSRDRQAHPAGTVKNLFVMSDEMPFRVIVYLEKEKKLHTGSILLGRRELLGGFQLEMASASVTLFSGIYKEISFRGSTAELEKAEERNRRLLELFPSLRSYIDEGF